MKQSELLKLGFLHTNFLCTEEGVESVLIQIIYFDPKKGIFSLNLYI